MLTFRSILRPCLAWGSLILTRDGLCTASLLLLFLVLAMQAHTLPLSGWLEASRSWLGQHELLGPALFLPGFVLAALFFVPGTLLTVAAGFLFGFEKGLLLSMPGLMLAAGLSFHLSRHTGRTRMQRILGKNRSFGFIDRALHNESLLMVSLLRLSPVPFGVSNFLCGLTSIRFSHYLLASSLGLLPGTILFAYLGESGGAALLSGIRSSWDWAPLAFSLAGVLAGMMLLRPRLNPRHIQRPADGAELAADSRTPA
jgi:uncharacterized membrane protein YdjX (TVP38/TMEM64 family)